PSLRYGQPALLDCGGGLAKLATLKQRQPLSLLRLRCSAQPGRGSPKYQIPNSNTNKDTPWRVLVSSGIRYFSPTPLWMRRGAEVQADKGSRCLSEASLARPRLNRAPQVARSEAEGRSNQGRLFFCLLFFWRSKRKVSSRRATPGQQNQEEERGG